MARSGALSTLRYKPARSRAAKTVFTSSIAIVIGPTPPGTGVMAAARAAAACELDVAAQFAVGAAVDADVDHDRAGFDPLAPHQLGAADRGDQQVGARDHVREIARLRMADRHRRVRADQQRRHRLADHVRAPDDHGVRAGTAAGPPLRSVSSRQTACRRRTAARPSATGRRFRGGCRRRPCADRRRAGCGGCRSRGAAAAGSGCRRPPDRCSATRPGPAARPPASRPAGDDRRCGCRPRRKRPSCCARRSARRDRRRPAPPPVRARRPRRAAAPSLPPAGPGCAPPAPFHRGWSRS